MNYALKFSREANDDIKEIYKYIKENYSNSSAESLILKIKEQINSLSEMPLRHPIYEIEKNGIEVIIHNLNVEKYIVIYEVDQKEGVVYIDRIIHSARDIKNILSNR